jgi:hypothetical protein
MNSDAVAAGTPGFTSMTSGERIETETGVRSTENLKPISG